MTYELILDLCVVISALALTSIAFSLHRLVKSEKFKGGGYVVDTAVTVTSDYTPPQPEIHVFQRGDRVRIKPGAFSGGMTGTVEFQEPGAIESKRRCGNT